MVIGFLEAKGTIFTNPTVAGILGVIIGTLLTGSLNFFAQRSTDKRRYKQETNLHKLRWQREDRIRFQADKLILFRDLLDEVRFAFDVRYCDNEMSSDLNSLVAEIDLLSSAEHVTKAAEKLVLATERWCETGAGFFRGDADEVEARKLAFEEAKADFQRASRIELGIPLESGGSSS